MTNIAPICPIDTKHRELSWFSERVDKGRKEPYVEITTVTPQIAKRLLEANDGNRPLSENLIAEIAADIEHGHWVLNGETIIVSKDGQLNDGQHRLEAVMRTDRSIQTAIMWGVPREARLTVDMGRQRTAGNFLAMTGVTHSNDAAALSRILINYSAGRFSTGGGKNGGGYIAVTKAEIRSFYNQNRKAISAALGETVNHKFAKLVGITPMAAAHFILHKANYVEAVVFFARLLDGANLKQGDPILFLRERLFASKKDRLRPFEKLELILRHWNSWRRGKKLSKAVQRDGAYPKVEK